MLVNVDKIKVNNRIKRSRGELAFFIIAFIFLALVVSTYVVSFFFGIMWGLKTHEEIILNPIALPKKPQFRNYIDAFTLLNVNGVNMIGMIANSLWLVIGGSVITIAGVGLMAYACTKYEFVGRRLLIGINIMTVIIPLMGALPSQIRAYNNLGMMNSPMILIAYIGGFGTYNLYMTAFFKNLSWEYAEAAFIDGAGHFKVLVKIMIPLAMGPTMALMVMKAVEIWNNYEFPLVFMRRMPTLATGIFLFGLQTQRMVRKDIHVAATMLSSIPILVLYISFNKTILTNVSFGGLKG